MAGPTPINNWPSARHFTEALQCPAVCFTSPFLRDTLPAVDKLGMPLVTSGQFAYVYKLNRPDGGSWGVRCFRAYLPDRQERYAALDAHFREHQLLALPRFAYEPAGLLVSGQRYPMLVMEWLPAPTLDNYLEKVLDRPDVLRHLAGEWARLTTQLRAAGVAHGDLQQGNILVQNGAFRLVDLDGMFVPALRGWKACEVGHQHFQHPNRNESWFDADLDNFSALSIYLSLIALAERPTLWSEYHDENLLFTRADFQQPDASPLFRSIRELGEEFQRLADILIAACRRPRPNVPPLAQLVEVPEESHLPAWMKAPAGIEVVTRTREAQRAAPPIPMAPPNDGRARPRPATYTNGPAVYVRPNAVNPNITTPASGVQTLFNGPAHAQAAIAPPIFNPADLWHNTFAVAGQAIKSTFSKIGAFWLLFLFSSVWIRLITAFWGMFDITAGPAFILTFLLIASGYLLYGFVKALDMWSQSPALVTANAMQSAALSGPVSQPPPALQAPAQAALPPATASNIPWYRQPNTPPAAQQPLAPGTRRAPDWAIRQASPLPTAPPSQTTPFHVPPSSTPTAAPVVPPAVTTPAPAASQALTGSMPPVIGNRDTKIYHWPDCEEAIIIAADDETPFVSPRAAELQGYRRCTICKPSSRQMPLTAPVATVPVLGNQESGVYHRPDCPWAASLKPPAARMFTSSQKADQAGFHRCTNCQPHRTQKNAALPPTAPPVAPTPARQLFIVGDKRQKIFHRWDCAEIQHRQPAELLEFVTPFVAYGNGYVRCPNCRP